MTIPAKKSNRLRILGIDPGIAKTGWGVVDYEGRRYGCFIRGRSDAFERDSRKEYTISQCRLLKLHKSISACDFDRRYLFRQKRRLGNRSCKVIRSFDSSDADYGFAGASVYTVANQTGRNGIRCSRKASGSGDGAHIA